MFGQDQRLDWETLWVRIETIILLTLLPLAPEVPDLPCCFELFGFDVLVDSALRPWLLEANSSPALSMDGPVDWLVKPQLLKDTLRAANIVPSPTLVESSSLYPS